MTGVALEKGRLSSRLLNRLRGYYGNMAGVGPDYVDTRWKGWKTDPHLITYVAKKGGEPVAWVIYNPHSSVIEEVLFNGLGPEDLLDWVIDALIARESLVAAEFPEADREKYRRLEAYGFRPDPFVFSLWLSLSSKWT